MCMHSPTFALQIRGELQRACKMLCGRSERVASIIAELCEEREDIIIQCPPGASSSGGRRQSAPSPASIATALPTDVASSQAADFRAWVQANATSGTLPGAAQLPGAAPYVHRVPMYNQPGATANPSGGPSDYGSQYRSNFRGYRSQPTYMQYGNTHRYNGPRQNYHRQHQNIQAGSYPQSASSSVPRTPTLGRRLSWDGSHSPSPIQQESFAARQQQPAYGYGSLRPTQTAPTSPTMSAAGFAPSSSSSHRLGVSGSSGGRSHSHSSLDRRQMPGPPFQPVPRPLESISFGNFHSSMINVMDTALARAEDRRRRGMQHLDSEHETITFGDVRVFRKSR